MSRVTKSARYTAYRDAIGAVLAARRNDDDAVKWLATYQPTLNHPAVDAFVAITCALMRELDRKGVDADELVSRWAENLAMRESK